MKTLLIGLGRQGKRILEFLVERGFGNLHICDVNSAALEELKNRFPEKVRIEKVDICGMGENDRIKYLAGFNFIVDSLPSALSWKILNSASKTKTATVSVSFLEEDFMKLDGQAKTNGSTIIPDCGAAPGFSHLLAGYSVNELGGADSVTMKLGAIPEKPVPPFCHSITWSMDDLLEEYVRPAKIRRNGEIKSVDPFDGIAKEEICGMKLESFVTDGARSFLTSFPEVKDMEERTLRYPGHLPFMKNLRDAGLIGRKPVDNSGIPPKNFLAKILLKTFGDLPKEDLFIMEIVAAKGARSMKHQYLLKYDHRNNVHALVNAVAITAAATLSLIADGKISKPGVYPLELLANADVYGALVSAHKGIGAAYNVRE